MKIIFTFILTGFTLLFITLFNNVHKANVATEKLAVVIVKNDSLIDKTIDYKKSNHLFYNILIKKDSVINIKDSLIDKKDDLILIKNELIDNKNLVINQKNYLLVKRQKQITDLRLNTDNKKIINCDSIITVLNSKLDSLTGLFKVVKKKRSVKIKLRS